MSFNKLWRFRSLYNTSMILVYILVLWVFKLLTRVPGAALLKSVLLSPVCCHSFSLDLHHLSLELLEQAAWSLFAPSFVPLLKHLPCCCQNDLSKMQIWSLSVSYLKYFCGSPVPSIWNWYNDAARLPFQSNPHHILWALLTAHDLLCRCIGECCFNTSEGGRCQCRKIKFMYTSEGICKFWIHGD